VVLEELALRFDFHPRAMLLIFLINEKSRENVNATQDTLVISVSGAPQIVLATLLTLEDRAI